MEIYKNTLSSIVWPFFSTGSKTYEKTEDKKKETCLLIKIQEFDSCPRDHGYPVFPIFKEFVQAYRGLDFITYEFKRGLTIFTSIKLFDEICHSVNFFNWSVNFPIKKTIIWVAFC